MKNKIKIFLFCSLLLQLFIACNNENKDKDEPDTIKENISDTVKNDSAITIPEKSMMLMDVSVSMKGYIGSGDSRLLGVVASYLNVSQNEPSIVLFGENEKTITKEEFINKLNTKSISWSNESDLKSMLKSMVSHCTNNDICFLLTDGILSGSNKQISNNPEFNIEQREWLSAEINKIFRDNKELSALMVKYNATFKGNYSCYNNNSVNINGKERPYYIIAIGKSKYIKYLEEKLVDAKSKILNKPYEDYALFGDESTYNRLKFSYNSGIKSIDNGQMIIKSEVIKDGDVILSADVSFLPPYMQMTSYWENNLELSVQNGQKSAKELAKEFYNISIDSISNTGKNCKITIQARKLKGRSLNIKLRYEMPSWIEKYTDENDLNIRLDPLKMSQTFNLKYFAEGLSALQNDENMINQTIKFK